MYARKFLMMTVLLVSATVQVQAEGAWGNSTLERLSGLVKSERHKRPSNVFRCSRTPATQFNGTITEAAIATPSLSTLVTALQIANLDGALAQSGHFTVFAPTNEAFAAIPEPILTTLLNNPDLLSTVLLYHVSETSRDPRRRFRARAVNTLADQPVILNRVGGTPKVNQSNVSCTPVKTSNGIVYVIDSVLFPQF